MGNVIIDQVMNRVDRAQSESDFEHFFSLLLAGEALFKTIILSVVASIAESKTRERYRLEYTLARADGLGDWTRVLEDCLFGVASQYLDQEALPFKTEINTGTPANTWQNESVVKLKSTLDVLGISYESQPAKPPLTSWFRLFVTLRNKTRAHGATPSSKASQALVPLSESINLIIENISVLQRPWASLKRNYSRKYRVQAIAGDQSCYKNFTKENHHTIQDGVYIHWGIPCRVPLISAEAELRDFYFANGGMTAKRYEMLSYLSDDKVDGEAKAYSTPPGELPASETDGFGELIQNGNCLTNAPKALSDYVHRDELELQLLNLLLDDRRAIVTLVGRGGIGKTSLSLKVIEGIYREDRFSLVIWLSARDVDLKINGPKLVTPQVVTTNEMAKLYASLVLSDDQIKVKGFNAVTFMQNQLVLNDFGSCLYVFDNFETTQNPVEIFNWIDTFIRLPNKVLITTRLRDFKGDYPLEVSGMEVQEARELIDKTAASLGVSDLIDVDYVNDIIKTSEGHPYIIKIILGELAVTRKRFHFSRMVAGNDELLTALFERTYAALSPCAQRALLTLADWNSSVPLIALEAVLMRSTAERDEVERGVESLLQYSLAEVHTSSKDQQQFIRLPLVASSFGKKKLTVSPLRASIQTDVKILQMLGPSRNDDTQLGMSGRMERFVAGITKKIEAGESLSDYIDILEMICRSYPLGWFILGQWYAQLGTEDGLYCAREALRRFLESQPSEADAAEAWRSLANVCFRMGDKLGEVHAFIERTKLQSVPFYDVSNTANRLNALLREGGILTDKDDRKNLAERIFSVLMARRDEADANDLSRMAWLALHLDNHGTAAELAAAGLDIDPDNGHCLSLQERFRASSH